MPDHPEDRTILALDMEGFGRQELTNPTRVRLRRYLDSWCRALLDEAQVSPEQWCALDTGDGFVFSVDPHVSRDVLLDRFVTGLAEHLARHNRDCLATERIRLRLAMHAGEVLRDPQPIHGEATVLAFRLLGADVLRACLAATEQSLAAIVSETIHDNIIKHGYPPIEPLDWYAVLATTKEGPRRAWVHVPGDCDAPRRAGVVAERVHPAGL
jgi:hypothetical protein